MHRVSQFTPQNQKNEKKKKKGISQQENESRTLVFQLERLKAKVSASHSSIASNFWSRPLSVSKWKCEACFARYGHRIDDVQPMSNPVIINGFGLLGYSLYYDFHEISFNESIKNRQLRTPKYLEFEFSVVISSILFNLN